MRCSDLKVGWKARPEIEVIHPVHPANPVKMLPLCGPPRRTTTNRRFRCLTDSTGLLTRRLDDRIILLAGTYKLCENSGSLLRMKMSTLLLSIICACCLYGCATPAGYTTTPMTKLDQHTDYAVDDFEGGFSMTIYYSRYQFIPESSAVDEAAKSQLLSLAHNIADKRNRPIQPINEQLIQKSMGRNGVTGITSWSGTVKVFYQED